MAPERGMEEVVGARSGRKDGARSVNNPYRQSNKDEQHNVLRLRLCAASELQLRQRVCTDDARRKTQDAHPEGSRDGGAAQVGGLAGCSAIWVGRVLPRGCWTGVSNSSWMGGFKKTHESFRSSVFDVRVSVKTTDMLTCTRMKESSHLSDGCRRIEWRSVASRLAATLPHDHFDAPAPPPECDPHLLAPAREDACPPPSPYWGSSSTERPHLGDSEFLQTS